MDTEILASNLEVYFDLCRWMGTCHCRGKIRYSDNCREGRGGLGWLQRKISQGEGGESNVCMYSVYSVLCNTIESYLQAYTLKPALSPPFPLFQFYFIVSPFLSFGAGLGGDFRCGLTSLNWELVGLAAWLGNCFCFFCVCMCNLYLYLYLNCIYILNCMNDRRSTPGTNWISIWISTWNYFEPPSSREKCSWLFRVYYSIMRVCAVHCN